MQKKNGKKENFSQQLKLDIKVAVFYYDEVSSDCQNIRNNFFICFPKQAHLVNLTYIS